MQKLKVKRQNNIQEIEGEWRQLLDESDTATVFQHPAWLEIWLAAAKFKPVIYGVYDEGELVGVAPFCPPAGGLRGIRFLGMDKIEGEALTDFGDIVARRGDEEKVWREVLIKLQTTYANSQISLDYVREDSQSFEIVTRTAKELGLKPEVVKQEVAPAMSLPQSWEEYLLSLEGKKRKELLRKMRRTEEREVKFEMVIGEIRGAMVDRLVELIKLSSSQKSEFMTGKVEEWFRSMCGGMMAADLGRYFRLNIQGEMVAGVIGFEWQDEWYLYNGGFDPGSGLYAPGVTLSGKIIQEAIRLGMKRIDFLRGGERYKYDLGAKDRWLYRLTLLR